MHRVSSGRGTVNSGRKNTIQVLRPREFQAPDPEIQTWRGKGVKWELEENYWWALVGLGAWDLEGSPALEVSTLRGLHVLVCLLGHVQLFMGHLMGCNPPGSSVHGISQARILEWVAMPSSRGSSRPRDGTHISDVSCTSLSTVPPGKPHGPPTSRHTVKLLFLVLEAPSGEWP